MFANEGCFLFPLAVVGLVLAFGLVLRLRSQVMQLETRVRRLETAGADTASAAAAPEFAAAAPARAPGTTAAAAGVATTVGVARPAAADRSPAAGVEPAPSVPLHPEPADRAPAAVPGTVATGTAAAGTAATGTPLHGAAEPTGAAGGAAPPPSSAPSPAPGPSWEVRLGSRLPAWIGSIALTLAGAFLVKYSLDQGWLGPEIRVLLAAGFGLAAVLVGQRLARGTASAGLVAAGVAVLYAAVLAATTLYGLIPPWAGFLATAGLTAWALLLALRHGPIVAVVGLLGGSLTPHLIQLGGPRPVTVSAYLLLLEVGLLQVSRRRGWTWLGPLSLLGLFAWALVSESAWSDAALLAGCVAAVAVLHEARSALQRLTVTTALAGTLLLFAGGALAAPMGPLDWLFLALLTTGMLVLGRLDERFEGLAWTGPALTALLLLLTASDLEPAGVPGYLATTGAFALLHAAAGYAALWRAPRPEVWARLPAVVGPATVLLAAAGIQQAGTGHAILWPAHGAALVLAVAAVPLLRRARHAGEGTGRAVRAGGVLANGAAVTLLLAPAFDLDGLALTLTWCLHAVLLAGAAAATALPVLAGAAAVAAALTTANLVLRPDLHYPRPGALPVLNRLLAAYGLPAAVFAGLAVLLARLRRVEPSEAEPGQAVRRATVQRGAIPPVLPRLLAWAAVLLTALLLGFEIWHAAHPADLGAPARLPEIAGLVAAWLGLALLLVAAGRRWPGWRLVAAADLLAVTAGLVAAIGLGIAVNPAFNDGVLVLPGAGRLLLAYGAPAVLFALWAARRGEATSHRLAGGEPGSHEVGERQPGERGSGERQIAGRGTERRSGALGALAGVAALFLAFLLVNLEVRHLFHPERLLLGTGTTGTVEHYAYSAAWLLFGAVLMAAGIWRRRRILRFSALAVLALAALKVFLYDTATLSDPYRVLSFLGLGICLLALAGLYQRLESHAPSS